MIKVFIFTKSNNISRVYDFKKLKSKTKPSVMLGQTR